ncbi:MAG: EamA family transporter, partial [Proteobacteria bacterium]|nr:EamA family transporter [Pseudomonadota bacterium]
TVLAMTLFLAGLQKLSNWELALLSTTEPVSAVFLAAIFLGERLSNLQVLGAVFVGMSLVLIVRPLKNSQIVR